MTLNRAAEILQRPIFGSRLHILAARFAKAFYAAMDESERFDEDGEPISPFCSAHIDRSGDCAICGNGDECAYVYPCGGFSFPCTRIDPTRTTIADLIKDLPADHPAVGELQRAISRYEAVTETTVNCNALRAA